MNSSPTAVYITRLAELKAGDRGILRSLADRDLDETVPGFDLFAGLWWPLREKSQKAPRRSVAWLIAKLHAGCPVPHVPGATFAQQLRKATGKDYTSVQARLDGLLQDQLHVLEPELRWAIGRIASGPNELDWVRLTDDLSIWERTTTRRRWAEEFIQTEKG